MGKLTVKVAILLIVVAGVSHYGLYFMTGEYLFSSQGLASNFKVPSLKRSPLQSNDQVYKWTDENGVVHYSSDAPTAQEAKIIEVDPNTNLIQGLESVKKVPEDPPATEAQRKQPQGNVYHPATIHKLIDDAKNVQNTLNERYQQLNEADKN